MSTATTEASTAPGPGNQCRASRDSPQPAPVTPAASASTANATEYEIAAAMAPVANAPSPFPRVEAQVPRDADRMTVLVPGGDECLRERKVLQAAVRYSGYEQARGDQDAARGVAGAVRGEPDRGQPQRGR